MEKLRVGARNQEESQISRGYYKDRNLKLLSKSSKNGDYQDFLFPQEDLNLPNLTCALKWLELFGSYGHHFWINL